VHGGRCAQWAEFVQEGHYGGIGGGIVAQCVNQDDHEAAGDGCAQSLTRRGGRICQRGAVGLG